MKKLIFLVLLVIPVLLIAQNESLETKMFFPDRETGEKAFFSKDFRYYQPDPNNLRAKPPRFAKGLPSAYIALEEVRENKGKSPAWIILPSGIPAEFNSSGVPIIDGRCWNKILEAYPLQEKYIPLSMIGKLYGPPGRDGVDGRDGKNGIDGKDALPPIKEASLWDSPWLMGGIAVLVLTLLFKLAWPHPSKTPAYIPPTPNLSDGGTLPPN